MILTTHALVGAAIGKNVETTWLVIIIAFASHFLLDSLRHGEYAKDLKSIKEWKKIVLDHFIGFSIIAISILITKPGEKVILNIILGTFFSMLPDLFIVLYKIFNIHSVKIFVELGTKVHPYLPGSPETLWTLRNTVNDIIFSLVAIFFLFY